MTRICRFDQDRLGIVQGDSVCDVTPALAVLPPLRWPAPHGDLLVANLDRVLAAATPLLPHAPRHALADVRLHSPVANPSKIVAAPVNYLKHQAEANADNGVNFDRDVKTIEHYGLFLKANSSLVGFGDGVQIAFPDRRTDHEIELVVVIGKSGRNIARADALAHVAGYMLGLDMTLRGPQDRSLRKSLDSFSVAGPWLVTADEVGNPDALGLWLNVDDQPRQRATTADLIFGVARLIEYAAAHYTLYPGDLIYTGTPDGVAPVASGDRITCGIEGLGEATASVRLAAPCRRAAATTDWSVRP